MAFLFAMAFSFCEIALSLAWWLGIHLSRLCVIGWLWAESLSFRNLRRNVGNEIYLLTP